MYRLYGRLTRSCTSQNAPVRRLGKCTNQIYDFASETEITRLEIMITRSGFAHCCIVVQLPDAYWCDSATGRCISQRDAKKTQAFFSSRIHYDAFLVVRVLPDVLHLSEAQYSIGQQLFLFGAARSKFLYVPGELSFELGDLKIKVTSIAWFKIHPGG